MKKRKHIVFGLMLIAFCCTFLTAAGCTVDRTIVRVAPPDELPEIE